MQKTKQFMQKDITFHTTQFTTADIQFFFRQCSHEV